MTRMKKFCLIISTSFIFLACNSDKTSNEKVGEDIEPYRQVGVKNVNGNIPDTTNSIDLSTNKVDSLNVPVDTPSKR